VPHYTRKGDDGDTTLWGGGRVPKHHQQPETYGALDEATSALGLARALSSGPRTDTIAQELQQGFYRIMAELAVAEGKPVPDQFTTSAADVERLEEIAAELEAEVPAPTEFVLPGGTAAGGALDLARSICRRAEREASRLQATNYPLNAEVMRFLNRASSVLYDLARYEEHHAGGASPGARLDAEDGG
jgi:cob(I)alamin adenosyltransferase